VGEGQPGQDLDAVSRGVSHHRDADADGRGDVDGAAWLAATEAQKRLAAQVSSEISKR
jgi:uncharacterized membrane protein